MRNWATLACGIVVRFTSVRCSLTSFLCFIHPKHRNTTFTHLLSGWYYNGSRICLFIDILMHGHYECWSFSSAGTNVTDDELDTMLESGQTDVFTQNVSPQGGVSTHTHTWVQCLKITTQTHMKVSFRNMINLQEELWKILRWMKMDFNVGTKYWTL